MLLSARLHGNLLTHMREIKLPSMHSILTKMATSVSWEGNINCKYLGL